MVEKRKSAIRKHYCTQKANIEQLVKSTSDLNKIITGDGDPKTGLFFKFEKFMDEHEIVVKNITEIKTGVDGLHKRADENRDAAATALSAIERYKLESASYDQGVKEQGDRDTLAKQLKDKEKKDEEDRIILDKQLKDKENKDKEDKITLAKQLKANKRQNNWQKVIWIVMAIIAIYAIYHKGDVNGKKIDNLGGVPVMVNPKGEIVPLENGNTLKMLPKDFNTADTIKKVNGTQK